MILIHFGRKIVKNAENSKKLPAVQLALNICFFCKTDIRLILKGNLQMKPKKRPIQRSLVLASALFISFMSFILSIQSYFSFSKSLYTRYHEHLSTIISFLESQIDKDDLLNCVKSREPSTKFNQLQQLVNTMVDEFDLFYLYIVYPGDTTMYSICSGTSREERENGETDYVIMEAVPGYTQDVLQKYQSIMHGSEMVYFEEDSEWGAAYTACKPLTNSQDIHYGLICADISIQELYKTMHHYAINNFILTIILAILFGFLLIVWLRRNITKPIQLLEQNTQHFAQKYHEKNDPNAITFEPPPIHTHNEVESLSKAITQMASDIRIYIQGIISAKEDAKTANEKAADMTLLAYRDTLTHVGSKIAYEETKTIVDQEIQAGKTSVAIAMVDLNNLKRVNDSYGHAHGDSYLFGSIQIICQVFQHSAIFRYGGDEFVILFKDNNDFKNRKELVQEALETFQKTGNDTSKQPWERYSAAIGLADYTPGDDMDSIFKRADSAMYQMKTEMKKHMN